MYVLAFSLQTVNGWMETGGYAVLFGLLFACGLGLPLPEDIPLMIAGALIAKGQMHFVPAAITAWCGIIGGDIMLYHLGKKFGLEITRLPFIGKHLTEQRITRVELLFQRYGFGVVAFGRLVAGIRGAMVVAAGAIRYNFTKFIITDGLAAVVSGGFFIFVGHWLGSRLNQENYEHYKNIFFIAAIVLAVGFIGWIYLRKKRHVDPVVKVIDKAAQVADQAQTLTKGIVSPSVSEPKKETHHGLGSETPAISVGRSGAVDRQDDDGNSSR